MLHQFGISGSAAVGHSLGELTALHWAGAFGEEALLRIARARGRAMAELGSPTGAMAAISTRAEAVKPLLVNRVSIVGFNSPRQTVVAGEAGAVASVIAAAQTRGLSAVKLAVSHAFHTSLVAAATPELARHLAAESILGCGRAVFSTVTGTRLQAKEDLRQLLIRQVTSPVRFTEAFAAADTEVDCWIEVGPGHVLSGHLRAKECLAEIEPDTAAQWFGRYLPGDLVLGDAGARDAAIHCVQACIPHRRLLPIGVERIELGGAPCTAKMRQAIQNGPTTFLLHARERRHEGDTFTYDLSLLSCDGCVLERWTGLRLRAVEDLKRESAWPAALLSPWLERKAEELIPGALISVAVEEAKQSSADGRKVGQASRLPGERFSASGEFASASPTPGVWRWFSIGRQKYGGSQGDRTFIGVLI